MGVVISALHLRRHRAAHHVKRERELATHVGDAGGPPQTRVRSFFAQDLLPVVKGVERLCESERIFCNERWFERPYRRLDDLVEPAGFENQPPQLLRVVTL